MSLYSAYRRLLYCADGQHRYFPLPCSLYRNGDGTITGEYACKDCHYLKQQYLGPITVSQAAETPV